MLAVDPYRYFFPAGWILGIWGVLLWLVYPLGWVQYPGLRHPEIMLGGFFLCFVCGFLMTAVPKFTASFATTVLEQRSAQVLISLLLFFSIFFESVYFYISVCALFLFLISYVLRRFLKRQSSAPDSFLFIGFGLGAGLVGAVLGAAGKVWTLEPQWVQVGRVLFMHAYIMCLVVGVGSRLVPALLGFTPLPHQGVAKKKSELKFYLVLAILFMGSYFLEALGWTLEGYLLRSLVLTYISIKIWKIYRYPVNRGVQPFWLWSSAWLMVVSHWAIFFFPNYRVHLVHVVLVSGLALMTLMIGVRVTLSHGGHSLMPEKKSKMLAIAGGSVALAGATRLSAGFAPHIYESHLLYAAVLWVFGLLCWGYVLIPKMIFLAPKKSG